MPVTTRFFPGFHQHLCGRKPLTGIERLRRKRRAADALCLTQLHTVFEDVLPPWLATFKTARGRNSRHCLYTPLVTFWAFLAQVLDADGSCRRAVTRVQTLCSALGLALPGEDTGAYCVARTRLPVRVLLKVQRFILERLGALPREGRRIVVMDGTSIRMADSQDNAAEYSAPMDRQRSSRQTTGAQRTARVQRPPKQVHPDDQTPASLQPKRRCCPRCLMTYFSAIRP